MTNFLKHNLKRQSLITFFLPFLFWTTTYGQLLEVDNVVDNWSEGQVDEEGNVIRAEIRRGGVSRMSVNEDSTVVFSGPANCGFGQEQKGTWTYDKNERTITFHFTEHQGYMNNPNSVRINEFKSYIIEKITSNELIMRPINSDNEKLLAFVKLEK